MRQNVMYQHCLPSQQAGHPCQLVRQGLQACTSATLALPCSLLSGMQADDSEEAPMYEALRMQVRRSVLVKWLDEPFLEKTVVGCLVRVTSHKAYIVAEIIGVVEREHGTYRCATCSCTSCVESANEMLWAQWVSCLECYLMLFLSSSYTPQVHYRLSLVTGIMGRTSRAHTRLQKASRQTSGSCCSTVPLKGEKFSQLCI